MHIFVPNYNSQNDQFVVLQIVATPWRPHGERPFPAQGSLGDLGASSQPQKIEIVIWLKIWRVSFKLGILWHVVDLKDIRFYRTEGLNSFPGQLEGERVLHVHVASIVDHICNDFQSFTLLFNFFIPEIIRRKIFIIFIIEIVFPESN
jgi:hypothetical protein